MDAAMKDIEIEIRARNNQMKERRLDLGLTQTRLSRRIGISLHAYADLEGMRRSPIHSGMWTNAANKIAQFFRVSPSYLWPENLLPVISVPIKRKLDACEMQALMDLGPRYLLPHPDEMAEHEEMRRVVDAELAKLGPREAQALRLSFGIGCDDHTLLDGSKEMGISQVRFRQIKLNALRRLRRHTQRTNGLL